MGFWKGLKITFRHFADVLLAKKRTAHSPSQPNYFADKENNGVFTLAYPFEKMLLPDNARHELFNEIDDCILCDKCADVCPVNCIEIESVRSPEPIGFASDGSPIRFYATKFDIDMSKCFFCGLCTTVCPTECLTMSQNYDISTFDLAAMNLSFSKLSAEEAALRKKEWDENQNSKKMAASMPNAENPVANQNSTVSQDEPPKPKIKIKLPPKKEE